MFRNDPIIGIDLGTTNCSVAVVQGDGQVKIIPWKGVDTAVPSVFAIDDKGNELIGHDAKRQWQLNPRNTIYGAKRLVGRTYGSDVVSSMSRVVQYPIKPGVQNDVTVGAAGKDFSLQQLSSKLLARLREIASDYLRCPVKRAVVTVPAYFNDRQRQAVKDAGKLIDLEVVRIINEPTAAALAYGVGRGLHEKVVVYDLGGGTFDVSIIEIRDRVFEVKATGGDIFLGGIDFDNAMIHHVIDRFRAEKGVDLSGDPVAMQRIKDLCERTKIDLSSRDAVPFSVPFVAMTADYQPLNIDMTFTRGLMEELTRELVDKSMAIVTRVLNDSGVSIKDIDEIMLVGGQTRMPLVQRRLTEYFGKAPSKGVHPDEAVAVGAALYAHSLEDDTNLRLQLLDVIPMAIGLEKAGGKFHVVFPRNAAIPNARQLLATTSFDQQTELAMRIYQGDQELAERNDLLGEFTFSGIRPAAAGEAQVEITFDVNVEGILTMRARDPDTGAHMETTVRVTQS
jgi:molecular chaperone DnaK